MIYTERLLGRHDTNRKLTLPVNYAYYYEVTAYSFSYRVANCTLPVVAEKKTDCFVISHTEVKSVSTSTFKTLQSSKNCLKWVDLSVLLLLQHNISGIAHMASF